MKVRKEDLAFWIFLARKKTLTLSNLKIGFCGKDISLVEKLSFIIILCQLGCVIPNICVNLDASFRTFMSH